MIELTLGNCHGRHLGEWLLGGGGGFVGGKNVMGSSVVNGWGYE